MSALRLFEWQPILARPPPHYNFKCTRAGRRLTLRPALPSIYNGLVGASNTDQANPGAPIRDHRD